MFFYVTVYASDYTVTGATNPTAANGDYTAEGDYYKHNTEDIYLFWDFMIAIWAIGPVVEPMGAENYFARTSFDILGAYENYSPYTGSVVVSTAAVVAGHPTTSQLLIGGMWFNDGTLQRSDWTRFERGTAE